MGRASAGQPSLSAVVDKRPSGSQSDKLERRHAAAPVSHSCRGRAIAATVYRAVAREWYVGFRGRYRKGARLLRVILEMLMYVRVAIARCGAAERRCLRTDRRACAVLRSRDLHAVAEAAPAAGRRAGLVRSGIW